MRKREECCLGEWVESEEARRVCLDRDTDTEAAVAEAIIDVWKMYKILS